LSPGKGVAQYRILSRIGGGGMGEVFLAQDTRLGRTVALKTMTAGAEASEGSGGTAADRFVQEARAASALSHPNIAHIYEIGDEEGIRFIAMEYVEGEPLARRISQVPLPNDEIIEYAAQIADALDEAHSKGIVHRDIKPANIMITPRGQVKLLDFGLAKVGASSAVSLSQATDTGVLTSPGVVLGTVQYMSPEQAMGREVDLRADLFSLGVVMYEMATGRLPFAATTPSEGLIRIVQDTPEPLARYNYGAPPELDRIVRKCLEKDRDRRYQSARELLVDLRNLQRDSDSSSVRLEILPQKNKRVSRRIDSIAVLPFTSPAGDADTAYLCEGLAEILINTLSQMPKLRVVPRTTVFRYKAPTDPQAIGKELNVRAVLAGTIVQRGEALRIQADLIDVAKETQIWGEQYNRKVVDLVAIQNEIAMEIFEKLRPRLSVEQRRKLACKSETTPQAYQAYLKGIFHRNRWMEDGFQKAIQYFEEAIRLDPCYALAYAGLGSCYGPLGFYGLMHPSEAFPKAVAAASRAVELDPGVAEAHACLALARWSMHWDREGAIAGLRHAIALNPNAADPHYSLTLCLASNGQLEEAFAAAQRAQELDPLSLLMNTVVGWALYFMRRFDQALRQFQKTLELQPDSGNVLLWIGESYRQIGQTRQALETLKRSKDLMPGDPNTLASFVLGCGSAADPEMARTAFDELEELSRRRYVSPYYFAVASLGTGDIERSLDYLEQAYLERSSWLVLIDVDARLDAMRSQPRFEQVRARMWADP
jgi:eukaryotic-like serine/threonine-protein kinase